MGRPVGMVRGERVNRAGRERAEKEHRDGMVRAERVNRAGRVLVRAGMVNRGDRERAHRDGMVRAERVNRAGRVLVRAERAPGAQVYREVFPG